MSDQPGFKKMPVPGRNELRPHDREANPERGVMSHVKPNNMVMDMGAPRDALTDWRGAPSPSSPTFRAGVPRGVNPSAKPEPKSQPIQSGTTWPNRDKKRVTEA